MSGRTRAGRRRQLGLSFSRVPVWLHVLPPGLLTWLTTRRSSRTSGCPNSWNHRSATWQSRASGPSSPAQRENQMVVTARRVACPRRPIAAGSWSAAGTSAVCTPSAYLPAEFILTYLQPEFGWDDAKTCWSQSRWQTLPCAARIRPGHIPLYSKDYRQFVAVLGWLRTAVKASHASRAAAFG